MRRSSKRVKRMLVLQNPGILGSIPTPAARFDLVEGRTGVQSGIATAQCTLKTPGSQRYHTGQIFRLPPGHQTLIGAD